MGVSPIEVLAIGCFEKIEIKNEGNEDHTNV
jgi:hypothetical protein